MLCANEALVYDCESAFKQPLLDARDEKKADATEETVANTYTANDFIMRRCSLAIGFIVGLFIQFSTIGVNFLFISMWGTEVVGGADFFSRVGLLSTIWSLVVTVMVVVVILCIHLMVKAALGHDGRTSKNGQCSEDIVQCIEVYCLIGAVVGIFLAVAITQLLLGTFLCIISTLFSFLLVLIFLGLFLETGTWMKAKP